MKKIFVLLLALLPVAASAQKSSFIVDLNGGFFNTDNAIAGGGVSLIWEAPVSNFYLGAGVGLSYRMGSEMRYGAKTASAHQAFIPVFAHAAYDLSENFKAALDAGCAAGTYLFAMGGPAYLFIPYAEPQIFYNAKNGLRLGLGYQLAYDKVRVKVKGPSDVTDANDNVMVMVRTLNLLSQAFTIHISKSF